MPISAAYSPIVRPERTATQHSKSGSLLPHLPWMAAVAIAPLWYGATSAKAQSILALLAGLSLLILSRTVESVPESKCARAALAGLGALLIVSIFPLPLGIPGAISPAAAELARTFPAPAAYPGTGTLSLSPAATFICSWQWLVLAAVFILARAAVRVHGFGTAFSWMVAGTALALAATQIWLLLDGKGVWQEVKHHPAGTFANRNHFAGWMAMASAFLIGATIRSVRALQKDRGNRKHSAGVIGFGVASLASMFGCFSSGSRGGALALGAGLTLWAILLYKRGERGVALGAFAVVLLAGVVAFALTGTSFMARMNEQGPGLKWAIWKDTARLIASFPLAGTGLGGFETAFTIHKSFGGESSFLFAENDYLQWIAETGLIGTALALLLLFPLVRSVANWFRFSGGTELFDGAIAALGAFSIHALFEFVTHVMALALLAAALAGVAAGLYRRWTGPRIPAPPGRAQITATLLLGAAVSGIALVQALAIFRWEGATRQNDYRRTERSLRRAMEMWPLNSRWNLAFARMNVAMIQSGGISPESAEARAREWVNRALAWRPFDWELRLERAWLALAFSPDKTAALHEARAAIGLNPLQAKIPVRLAAALSNFNGPAALEMLRNAPLQRGDDIAAALETVWKIERNPSVLWEFTPATPEGFAALEQFARNHDLMTLAREARERAKTQ